VFGSFVVTFAQSLIGGIVCCEKIQKDNIAPIFVSDLTTVEAHAISGCQAVVTWTEPYALDCNLKTVSSNYKPGNTFPLGETLIEYIATDLAGNKTVFHFGIKVIDAAPPVIQKCPSNIALQSNDGSPVAAAWDVITATDNCQQVTLLSDYNSGDLFPIGETAVTYTARDAAGNTSVCTYNVVVTASVDTDPDPDPDPDPDITKLLDIVLIITPDGDGNNDYWKINNIDQFDRNEVKVVDRWGSVVFNKHNYDNEVIVWRGTSNDSRNVPTGTYFYTITLWKSGKRSEKHGFVEVIN